MSYESIRDALGVSYGAAKAHCSACKHNTEPVSDPVQTHRARIENADVRKQLHEATTRAINTENIDRVLKLLDETNSKPPTWTVKQRKRSDHTAIINTILSDCHFDETVNPEAILVPVSSARIFFDSPANRAHLLASGSSTDPSSSHPVFVGSAL
jgi:hypothetical protein